MKPLGDQNAHFWLIQRMARATETDLVKAMDKAKLTQSDWADMVQECRHCDWSEGCERWLGRQDHDAAADVPEACRNHTRFEALKAALEELEE
ncbi:MAG: DUF6455 family protein [Shimia thalassica]|uniref:DUF6455 family protein n=1 Tax=Shimia thalassica TaxID=1715693 RepID=UPI0032984465